MLAVIPMAGRRRQGAMASFLTYGYAGSDFLIDGGGTQLLPGATFHVDPTWDASVDRLTFTFSDDDSWLGGDLRADELGVDQNQYLTITDATGATVNAGVAYSEEYATLTAPDGSIVFIDRVEINGELVGYVTSAELQPGVTYQVSSIYNVDSVNEASYYDFDWLDYDPDTASYIRGGNFSDTLLAGAGDDRIEAGGGADIIDGGSGNDTIYYGTGGSTPDQGDLVEGGEGDDLIDDVSGSFYEYADTLSGGAGADTIWAGGGADLVDGGADADVLYGESGDDTITGGAGDDLIWTGTGADVLIYTDGSGADTIGDFNIADNGSGFAIDRLDVSDLTDADGNPVNVWDVVVSQDPAGNAVLTFPGGETITLSGIAPSQVSTVQQLNAIGIPCFLVGTRIATPRGWRAVEDLCPGDLVVTRDGPPAPVLWIGRRQVDAAQLAENPALRPIRLRAGAFGNDCDLVLSGQHAIWVQEGAGEGALVRVCHLARTGWGGARVMAGIRQAAYLHLLLPRHALILAEGAWVETFWPGRFALESLDLRQRCALVRSMPRLARVVFEGQPVEASYGPRVRALLPGKAVTRSACVKWSRSVQDVPRTDGFWDVLLSGYG
ncbi:hypothetical protein CLN94_04905 [Pseudothioclava arenosa]|uniref:Hedgehog/Intein (Hint) domain-containing protein n=2 Tax=Pseudothioclava arenosa TaxID=1795308 RepID=A0A2A4CSM1_9RHOB|nr:hypothetical protein CLN94_04905 [Pseudothioclava arenosa]